jgi:hypothetical protein
LKCTLARGIRDGHLRKREPSKIEGRREEEQEDR